MHVLASKVATFTSLLSWHLKGRPFFLESLKGRSGLYEPTDAWAGVVIVPHLVFSIISPSLSCLMYRILWANWLGLRTLEDKKYMCQKQWGLEGLNHLLQGKRGDGSGWQYRLISHIEWSIWQKISFRLFTLSIIFCRNLYFCKSWVYELAFCYS